MNKAKENLIRRDVNISTINKWILKEGYIIIINREDSLTCLGLYTPAETKNDIPQFQKYLIRGNNIRVNNYIQGMHDALNLCK